MVLDGPHHPDLANQQGARFSKLCGRKLGTSGSRRFSPARRPALAPTVAKMSHSERGVPIWLDVVGAGQENTRYQERRRNAVNEEWRGSREYKPGRERLPRGES